MSALIEKTSEIIVCDNLVEISINRDQCEFKLRQLKKKKKKKRDVRCSMRPDILPS